jgi:hypothetical protein
VSYATSTEQATVHYVGFGGSQGTVTGKRVRLGVGVEPKKRSWLWHFSFGYVSGFPVSAIVYYLLTRHTTAGMKHWSWLRERDDFIARNNQPWDECGADDCKRCNPQSVSTSTEEP